MTPDLSYDYETNRRERLYDDQWGGGTKKKKKVPGIIYSVLLILVVVRCSTSGQPKFPSGTGIPTHPHITHP